MKCSLRGCKNARYAKGLCEVHYWRQRRHGDPAVLKVIKGRVCSVPGCGRKHKAHGLCRLHARRLKVNGDPQAVQVLRVPGRICSVDGCSNPYAAKGLCKIHYARWHQRGGDLNEPRRPPGGEPLRFLEAALKWDSDECLYWPYTRKGGYARLSAYHGLGQNVCRIICERVHGPAPSKKHQASHTCHKGNQGCVNSQHLLWETSLENGARKSTRTDAIGGRGSRHYKAKLTEDQVRTIRSLLPTMRKTAIANRFGVTIDTISAIADGRSWAWLI
jgi:hypothetical protein